jgi:predicted nuclease of predicted toxin-antitoxin system
MRYVVDQMLAGLAKELSENGVDCSTVQKAIRGDEDSSKSIEDSEIFEFLVKSNGSVALITMDNDLASYCKRFGIPHIRVQEAVLEAVRHSGS